MHYIRNKKVAIRNIGGITLLGVFVSFFMNGAISKIILASIFLFLWIRHLLSENIEELFINEPDKKLRIVVKNFQKERMIELDINELELMFSDKVGARGTWLTVFCILHNKKEIFRINPGTSGWDEGVLLDIIKTIERIKPTNI